MPSVERGIIDRPPQRAFERERDGPSASKCPSSDDLEGKDSYTFALPTISSRSPRSRGPVGVGDVAGERGAARRAVDAFNRRDLERLSGDSWTTPWSVIPRAAAMEGGDLSRPRRSPPLVEDMFERLPRLHHRGRTRCSDLGDVTVASRAPRGHGAGSDAPLEETIWQVDRWRRGKCVWWRTSTRGPKPSKPWGCRSKTLTPTPEPAGYCAGDVAGERGDGASGVFEAFNGRPGCLSRDAGPRSMFPSQPQRYLERGRQAISAPEGWTRQH